MRIFKLLFTFLLSTFLASCTGNNAFTQFSNQTSDEAIYQEALKKIDQLAWQEAIDLIETQMSAGYQQNTNVRESLMGAYAGKCGLSFVTLINGLSTATGGIFSMALGAFGGVTVDTASCDSAVTILQSLGTSVQRTQNQNFYAAILGLAKLGVNLHNTLDQETSGAGDGTVDAGWDSCPDPGASTAGRLTDAEVKKAITGVGLIFENVATLVTAMGTGNAGVNSLDAAKTECESLAGAGNCTITDENSAAITPEMIRFFRRMISSSSLGLGTCDINDMATPSCCPLLAVP